MSGGPQPYLLPPEWETAINGWAGWLKLGGIAPRTRSLRRNHIRSIARRSATERPQDITFADLVSLCSEQQWSNEHRKGVRRSLVSFFDWCVDAGLIDTSPAERLPRVRAAKPNPRPATDDVWASLLASCGERERLMARLAGEAGMRRAEVAACHRDDLIDDPRGPSLIVHGKGGKQRVVPIAEDLAVAIRNYCGHGYVFPGQIVEPGHVEGHISADYVGRLLSRLMPSGWSMHKLRHRYATRAFRGSRNLLAVRDLLGHSSVATTQIYTAVDRDEIRAAAMSAL